MSKAVKFNVWITVEGVNKDGEEDNTYHEPVIGCTVATAEEAYDVQHALAYLVQILGKVKPVRADD